MNKIELQQILKSHTAWVRGDSSGKRADLREADLRGADLRGADLRRANLSVAYLSGTNLRGADLYGADLCGADLRGADLREADLRRADLSGANLRDVKLDHYVVTRGGDWLTLNGAYWILKGHYDPNRLDNRLLGLVKLHL